MEYEKANLLGFYLFYSGIDFLDVTEWSGG